MRLSEYDVYLTDHAYEQYLARVGEADREDLQREIAEGIAGNRYTRERQYLQVEGVWWVYAVDDAALVMVTCYGRTHLYLPAAKRWEKQNHDRVVLGGEVVCDG